VVDNGLPTVTLSAPTGVLSGTTTLTAAATDAASGVASVTFAYRRLTDVSWTACGTDAFAPYTCALDTTALADGSYLLRAAATDVAGNQSLPSTLTRSVDNSPASVSITAPAAGSTVSATTSVTVAATSGRGVASVRVEARALPSGDFVQVCTVSLPPYSCDWNVSALSGSYALRAVLTETDGGATATSAVVNVTVDNAVGSLAITSPAAGATVSGSVTVSATAAAAPSRTVTSVRFESGPVGGPFTAVCTDLVTPYSCPWNTSGTVYGPAHRVRAVMTQSDLSTITTTIAVVVDNVTGSVDLVSPAPGGRLTGTVPVSVSVASNAAATGVEVLATSPGRSDLLLACTAAGGTPPAAVSYSCPWDTTAVTRASYTLQARATLANGVQVTDGAVTGLNVRNLRAVDVQAAPTKKFGELNGDDAIILTWSDLVAAGTLPTGGTATIVNDTAGDRVQLPGNLGTVRFGTTLVTAGMTVPVSVSTTIVTRDGVQVTQATVTFGSLQGNAPTGFDTTPTQLVWTPTAGVRAADLTTDDCATDPVSESGSLDGDV
ncbi:MAG: Ig-like domain-containing protein, partial [Nocardioides sp.]|nr:Ig-like domain-containing protein [Nocardioides sp.]